MWHMILHASVASFYRPLCSCCSKGLSSNHVCRKYSECPISETFGFRSAPSRSAPSISCVPLHTSIKPFCLFPQHHCSGPNWYACVCPSNNVFHTCRHTSTCTYCAQEYFTFRFLLRALSLSPWLSFFFPSTLFLFCFVDSFGVKNKFVTHTHSTYSQPAKGRHHQ